MRSSNNQWKRSINILSLRMFVNTDAEISHSKRNLDCPRAATFRLIKVIVHVFIIHTSNFRGRGGAWGLLSKLLNPSSPECRSMNGFAWALSAAMSVRLCRIWSPDVRAVDIRDCSRDSISLFISSFVDLRKNPTCTEIDRWITFRSSQTQTQR